MQALLNARGYDAGKPDGLVGPQTREALRAFQLAAGLPADGYPTVDVIERLREDDDVRVIILRAAPSPAFCTGADTKGGPGITPYRTPESRLKPWSLNDPAESPGANSTKDRQPPLVAV